METKSYCLLLILILYLLAPANSIALPVNYSAHGSVVNSEGDTLQIITGEVTIDNVYSPWFGSEGAIQYNITEYSFQVGTDSYSGGDGFLYVQLGGSTQDNNTICDAIWQMGIPLELASSTFRFYNADGSMQNLTDSTYSNLAPLIELWDSTCYIWLTQESSAPVPEPATLLLFGSSLLGMLAYRKVRR